MISIVFARLQRIFPSSLTLPGLISGSRDTQNIAISPKTCFDAVALSHARPRDDLAKEPEATMIQPNELKSGLRMDIANGVIATTSKVWEILSASYNGNLERIKELVSECSELIYAQYNYTPPIHFAVREGHAQLVNYLLKNGAHNPVIEFIRF